MKKFVTACYPFFIIIGLSLLLFGKTLFPSRNQIIYGGDLQQQFYYWKGYLKESLQEGIIPFWNPYSFSGTPFLSHPSTAAFYPINFIFFLFPINLAFSIYIFIHVILAGFFMYFFVRQYTDKLSALAGSIVFSLSGLMAARIYSGHIDIISTLTWIPAVFGLVNAALNSYNKKHIVLSVVFLTLQILAGYQAVVIFTLELIIIYQIVQVFLENKNISSKVRSLILILIISYGISAIQILPTIEFVRNSIRRQGLPYETLTWGSYTIDQFISFIDPFRYGNPFPENYTYRGPGPNFFEVSYFAGVMPILLFFIYIFYKLYKLVVGKKRDRVFIGLTVGLIFFMLVAMGGNTPLHKLLYQTVPLYRLFRFPSQHLIMAVFIIAFFSSLALSLVGKAIFRAAILIVIIFELLVYDKKFIRFASIPTNNFDTQLVNSLKEDRNLVRILPDYSVISSVRNDWDFESSPFYKIQSTSGYNPILLDSYYHFIDLINKKFSSSIQQYNVEIPPPDPQSAYIDFLNIKYLLVDRNFDTVNNNFPNRYELLTEGKTYKLYENSSFLPRFFTVREVNTYSTEHDLENAILLGRLDMKNSIGFVTKEINDVFLKKLNCQDNSIDEVSIISYSINNTILKTDSSCDRFLSTSEIYYPGWQARLDGQPTKVYLSNSAFRSIYVPKGVHKVEFYYRPTVYYIGGGISVFTIVFLICYFILGSRNLSSRLRSGSINNY